MDRNKRYSTTDATPTNHAELRYLQRVDATEPFPRERLREMARRAREIEHPNVSGAKALYDAATDMALVFDDTTREIVTLFQGGDTA
jgi:hypothetical protein